MLALPVELLCRIVGHLGDPNALFRTCTAMHGLRADPSCMASWIWRHQKGDKVEFYPELYLWATRATTCFGRLGMATQVSVMRNLEAYGLRAMFAFGVLLRNAIRQADIVHVARALELIASKTQQSMDLYCRLALSMAVEYRQVAVMRVLMDAGLSASAHDAFHRAVINGQTDIVRVMLDGGVDVHTGGDFALKCACRRGSLLMVRVLLKAGADANAQTSCFSHQTLHID